MDPRPEQLADKTPSWKPIPGGVSALVVEFLGKHGPSDIQTLCRGIDIRRGNVTATLRHLHGVNSARPVKAVYVFDYVRSALGKLVPRYALGDEDDAERPAPKVPSRRKPPQPPRSAKGVRPANSVFDLGRYTTELWSRPVSVAQKSRALPVE